MPGGNVRIRIDESADARIIIAGLQIVEAGFAIVIITAIADGVEIGVGREFAGIRILEAVSIRIFLKIVGVADGHSAPGIVFVNAHYGAVLIDQRRDVALQVLDVIEGLPRDLAADRFPIDPMEEIDRADRIRLGGEGIAGIDELRCAFGEPFSGSVVGEGRTRGGNELPAVLPGQRFAEIRSGIPDRIIADRPCRQRRCAASAGVSGARVGRRSRRARSHRRIGLVCMINRCSLRQKNP